MLIWLVYYAKINAEEDDGMKTWQIDVCGHLT